MLSSAGWFVCVICHVLFTCATKVMTISPFMSGRSIRDLFLPFGSLWDFDR